MLLGAALLAAVTGSMVRPAAAAGVPAPAELVRGIDAGQQDLRTLQAEFVQRSRIKLFKQELTARGRLLYARAQAGAPTRLRWEYLQPDPSTLLLIGDRAVLKMAGRPPQVFDGEKDPGMHAIFTQLQLWLGQGSLQAAQADYGLLSGGTSAQPALILTPKATTPLSRTFARIEMHVDGRSMQLLRLLLVETSGDEKEITFTAVKRNAALPKGAFDGG